MIESATAGRAGSDLGRSGTVFAGCEHVFNHETRPGKIKSKKTEPLQGTLDTVDLRVAWTFSGELSVQRGGMSEIEFGGT